MSAEGSFDLVSIIREMVVSEYLGRLQVVLIIIAGGTVLEFFSEYERQGLVSRLRGLLFWMFYLAGLAIAASLVRQVATIFELKPLLTFDLRSFARSDNVAMMVLGILAFPLIPILLSDFLYYWFHRLQHAVPLLWRFHAVHHAIEELSIANCAHRTLRRIFLSFH